MGIMQAQAQTLGGSNGNEIMLSFVTIKEMLVDRGLDVSSVAGEEPAAVLLTRCGADRSDVFFVDIDSCGVRVVYNMHPKLRMTDIKKQLDSAHTTHIVVARERQSLGKGLPGDVQVFELAELQYNLSRHELVPRHIAIRDEAEIEVVTKRYGLKSRYQLPLILHSDPMARYLAIKPGQLVRIVRQSPSAGTYSLYRCCQKA